MVKVSIILAVSSAFVVATSYLQSLQFHRVYYRVDDVDVGEADHDDDSVAVLGGERGGRYDDEYGHDDSVGRRFETSKRHLQQQSRQQHYERLKKYKVTKRRRTRAVIHMGPHKTGSTTIQDQTKVWSKQLLLDRYEMPWTNLLRISSDDKEEERTTTRNAANGKNATHGDIDLSPGVSAAAAAGTKTTAPLPWTERNFKWNNPSHQYNFAMCFMDNFFSSTDPNNTDPAGKCIHQLLLEGSNIASRNNNLLVTAEEFDLIQDDGIRMLKAYLSQWDDISLVVYHRRLYDRIISSHNQINKRKTHSIRLESLKPMLKFIEKHHLDPKSIGYAKQTVPLLQRLSQHFDKETQIVVRDFHDDGQDGSLAKRFFCDALLDAEHTCTAIRRNSVRAEQQIQDLHRNSTLTSPLTPPRSNTKTDRSHLDYRFIVGGALKSGLISRNESSFDADGSSSSSGGSSSGKNYRKEQERLVDEVQNYHENVLKLTATDFPRICPSKDLLDRLWNATLTYELWMYENYFSNDKYQYMMTRPSHNDKYDDDDDDEDEIDDDGRGVGESYIKDEDVDNSHDNDIDYNLNQYIAWLRNDFEIASRTSLCELDVQAVLNDLQWRTFFQNLSKNIPSTV